VIKFDKLADSLDIPKNKRDITPLNIDWMLRNLALKNSKHPNFAEAIVMLKEFAREVKNK
jgi:hypothetical protein